MRNKLFITGLVVLFTGLTVFYFRDVIWSPADYIVTRHLATDVFGHFLHANSTINLLSQGVIPLGDYWVHQGGGYPSALNDLLLLPQDLLISGVYMLTDSFATALKVVDVGLHLTIPFLAFWYGTILLKRRDASIIFAVAFTFCLYSINQLEHIEQFSVQPFVLLVLIFLEKAFASPHRVLYIILASLSALFVWNTSGYPFVFLAAFMGLRVIYQLTKPNRSDTLQVSTKIAILTTLAVLPFALPLLTGKTATTVLADMQASIAVYSQPPSLFFLRDSSFVPYQPEIYYMYVGITVLLLALIPMVMRHSQHVGLYVFCLLTTLLFMLYSIGQYGPANIALWVNTHIPLVEFIRVPGRAMLFGYLSLSVCAAIGYSVLADRLPTFRWKSLLVVPVVLLIFADLTIGYEPPTQLVSPTPTNAYQFVKAQEDDGFRVLEIPTVNGQQALAIIETEHDVLSDTVWAFGHFEPLWDVTQLYHNYAMQVDTPYLASEYGVKYIIVNTNPEYFDIQKDAIRIQGEPDLVRILAIDAMFRDSSHYELVYSSDGANVFENLEYRGIVYSKCTPCSKLLEIQYSYVDANTLVIDIRNHTNAPIDLNVSQCYSTGWSAVLEDGTHLTIEESDNAMQVVVDIPAGIHTLTLHYQSYDRWFVWFTAVYAVLLGFIAFLWWRSRRRTL